MQISSKPRTCRDQNCAPVCPHIIITPTVQQQTELYRLIQIAYCQSEISEKVKDDLLNMVMKRGAYRD
jgi:hypothetical protein